MEKKTGKDEFNPEQLLALAGLDKTPEAIAAEIRALEVERSTRFWRFTRWRRSELGYSRLPDYPEIANLRRAAIFRRVGGWVIYDVAVSALVVAGIYGVPFIMIVLLGAVVALIAMTTAVRADDDHNDLEPVFVGPILAWIALFGLFIKNGAPVTLGLLVASPISALLSLVIAAATVSKRYGPVSLVIEKRSVSKSCDTLPIRDKPFTHCLARLFVAFFLVFPLMPFIRLIDLWIVRHQNDPRLIEKAEAPVEATALPIARIQETYLAGLTRVREMFLGEKADIRESIRTLEHRMDEICTQKERVAHRMRDAEAKQRQDRIESLTVALQRLTSREDRMREAIERIRGIVAKTDALLLECEARVKDLDGPLGDAELVRSIEEGEERDDAAIAAVDLVVEQSVSMLGDVLIRLHTVIADAALPPSKTDHELTAYFGRLDDAADRIADLETVARNPLLSDSVPAEKTVH